MENTVKNQNSGSQTGKKFDWQKKNVWMWVVVILVVALIIIITTKKEHVEEASSGLPESELISHDGETALSTESTKPARKQAQEEKASTAANAASSLSYDEAVVKYAGARIQFDAECNAMPSNIVLKDGVDFMLDNRAGVNQSFYLNGDFHIAPYGFKIMKLSSDMLPRQYLIDCGAKQNVATILLQD